MKTARPKEELRNECQTIIDMRCDTKKETRGKLAENSQNVISAVEVCILEDKICIKEQEAHYKFKKIQKAFDTKEDTLIPNQSS